MPTLARGRTERGFTLVEVLVVLAITGIALGGVTLAIDAARRADPQLAVERLRHALEAGATRAGVRGRALAVDFVADGYRFSELDADGRWRALDEPPLYVSRELPDGLRWGRLATSDGDVRRLVFGRRTPPFELVVLEATRRHVLSGDRNGRVTLEAQAR